MSDDIKKNTGHDDDLLPDDDKTRRMDDETIGDDDKTIRMDDDTIGDDDRTIRMDDDTISDEDKTIRVEDDVISDSDKTIRIEDNEKTIRTTNDDVIQDDDKTIRADEKRIDSETIQDDDKTVRMDETEIKSTDDEQIEDDDKTQRIDDSAGPGVEKIKSSVQPGSKPKEKKEEETQKSEVLGPDCFDLKGDIYNTVKLISDETGEAEIFLVEKDGKKFVLKLYFRNYKPKLPLVKKLREFTHKDIIKVFDFGYTGDKQFYELMEFAAGGTLDKHMPIKNVKKIKEIVDETVDALNFCHGHGIIHRDIKPSNLFYRNADSTDVLIADFGISSLFDEEVEMHKTKQTKTEIFAPPEMYLSMGEGVTMITPKVDYYALGITVLYLWTGENPFKGVPKLMLPNIKNDGKIKIPDDIDSNVRTLIKGLTVVKAEKRWGYNEVQRWLKGEDVPVFEETVSLDYKPFMFDAAQNLIAKTPEELAGIMEKDKALAQKYLYRGKITKWLEEANNQRLAVEIEEIYEKLYPKDEEAGVMAAIYKLDQSIPYTGIDGRKCVEDQEFAQLFLDNFDEYKAKLSKKSDTFYVFIESKGDTAFAAQLWSYFKGSKDQELSLLKVIYDLYPDAKFRFSYEEYIGRPPKVLMLDKVEEIVRMMKMHQKSGAKYLFDGGLLFWLEKRANNEYKDEDYSKQFIEPIKWVNYVTQNYQKNKSAALELLYYGVDKNAKLLSRDGKTERETKEDIGNEILSDYQEYIKLLKQPNSSINLFMLAKGWKKEQNYVKFCFDMKNHKDKMVPYNESIAIMKIINFFGVGVAWVYDDKTYDDPDELMKAPSSVKKDAREFIEDIDSFLNSWLSLYFHEHPDVDFDKTEYAYENKLLEYFEFVKKFAPGSEISKRYEKARKILPKTIKKEKKLDRRFNFTKLLAILLPLLTGGAVFLYAQYGGGAAAFDKSFWQISLNYYVIFALIFTIYYFISDGFGEGREISTGCLGGPIVGAILAIIFYVVFSFTIGNPYLLGGLILLIVGFGLFKIIPVNYGNREMRRQLFNMDDRDEFELEPLYFALSDDEEYETTRLDLLDQYHQHRRRAKWELKRFGFIPSLILLAVLIVMALADPNINTYTQKAENLYKKALSFIPLDMFSGSAEIPEIKGMWRGEFGDTPLVMNVTKQTENTLNANLSILYSTHKHYSITGVIDSSSGMIELKDNSGGVYMGEFSENNYVMSGMYRSKAGENTAFKLVSDNKPEEVEEKEPVKEDKEPSEKPEETKRTETKKSETPKVTPPVVAEEKPAEEKKTDTETKIPAVTEKKTPVKTDKEPVVQEKKKTPVIAEEKPVVEKEPVKTEEKKTEVKKEAKLVLPKKSIQMRTGQGFRMDIYDCYRVRASIVRIKFFITDIQGNRTVNIPASSIMVTDWNGNRVPVDQGSLGGADLDGTEINLKMEKMKPVEGSFVFRNFDENVAKIRKLEVRLGDGSWETVVFEELEID